MLEFILGFFAKVIGGFLGKIFLRIFFGKARAQKIQNWFSRKINAIKRLRVVPPITDFLHLELDSVQCEVMSNPTVSLSRLTLAGNFWSLSLKPIQISQVKVEIVINSGVLTPIYSHDAIELSYGGSGQVRFEYVLSDAELRRIQGLFYGQSFALTRASFTVSLRIAGKEARIRPIDKTLYVVYKEFK